jgi:outer membrane beta-barrel protein
MGRCLRTPERRRSLELGLLAFLGIGLFPILAAGKPRGPAWEESDKLPAVQNRLYRVEHEFQVGIGVLPVDAFYKGVSFGGGYAWHITDLWAVELRAAYMQNVKTSLRDKLENNFGEPPSKFAEIKLYGEIGGLFKPIYGKLSFLNKSLVYGELYLSLSAIVARMEGGTATDDEPQGKGDRMAFGGAPGFGLRGYLNRYLSLRFDFRYMLLYSRGEGHYPLALTLNLAVTTRSDL